MRINAPVGHPKGSSQAGMLGASLHCRHGLQWWVLAPREEVGRVGCRCPLACTNLKKD